jgi:hypothetical protein
MPIGSAITSAVSRAASYAAAQIDARDLVLVVGLGLLSAGLYQLFVPLAFIVPGTVLTYVAVWGGPKVVAVPGADD